MLNVMTPSGELGPPRPLRTLEPVDLDDLEDETESPEVETDPTLAELERAATQPGTKRGNIESPEGERG